MKLSKNFYKACSIVLLSTFALSTGHTKQIVELDRIIAVVNNGVITHSELKQRVRVEKQQLKKNKVKLPPESVLQKRVLERLVIELIMLQLAERRGIRVSDETVSRYITSLAKEQKLTLSQFRSVLKKDGFSFAEFRQTTKNNMIMDRIKRQVVDREVKITTKEIDNYLAKTKQGNQTEYKLSHILIGIPEASNPEQISKLRKKADKVHRKLKKGADFSQTAISNSDGQQALSGGKMGWLKGAQLPNLFLEEIEKMRKGNISQVIRSPSGFHILKLENKRSKGGRHFVKQSLARHILITPNVVLSDADAKKKLEKIRQQILTGADFGKLAKTHSDDKGSAADGGSLGWTGPGTFVPEFEKTLKKLKQGEISKVFRSPYGWHIIQLMSRRKHDDTEAYQRQQIKKQVFHRKANEAVENWARRIHDEAYVEYMLEN